MLDLVRRPGRFRGPLMAVVIGLSACSHGVRYAPARPFDAVSDSAVVARSPKLATLLSRFVRQQTDASCSVAATATVLGAALAQRSRPAASQADVLRSDATGRWEEQTRDAQSSGVTLDELALHVMQSFYAQGIRNVGVNVMHVRDAGSETEQMLVSALEKSESSRTDFFIIINFLQSAYFQDGEAVGHMSVIGAYDAQKMRALVLDVDAEALQPYWVPLSVLLAGMNTADDETGDARGYLIVRVP